MITCTKLYIFVVLLVSLSYLLLFSPSVSHVRLFATPWTAACQASPSITIPQSLLNSRPLNWWCHPTISSPVIPFSSCLQSFPATGSFPISPLFTLCGQTIGASASLRIFRVDFFKIDWFDLLQGILKHPLQHRSSEASILWMLISLYGTTLTSIRDYWKNHSLTRQTLLAKQCLCFLTFINNNVSPLHFLLHSLLFHLKPLPIDYIHQNAGFEWLMSSNLYRHWKSEVKIILLFTFSFFFFHLFSIIITYQRFLSINISIVGIASWSKIYAESSQIYYFICYIHILKSDVPHLNESKEIKSP